MEVVFRSDDGKIFNDENECVKYEKNIENRRILNDIIAGSIYDGIAAKYSDCQIIEDVIEQLIKNKNKIIEVLNNLEV